jgi:hypothetical protein
LESSADKGIAGALLCLLLLTSLFTYLSPVPAHAAPQITLTPTSGGVGTIVIVSGTGFPVNSGVTISYDGAQRQTTPATVTADSTGAFSATFSVPSSATGAHTVVATSGAVSANATFTVTPAASITLSPASGATGATVTVTGSNFGASSTVRITFDGSTVTTNPATVTTTSTGTFSATFAVPASSAIGPHSVAATSPNGNTDSTVFSVVTGATSTLTVRSQNADGGTITGYYTILRNSAGSTIATGFTPATFTLTNGLQYSVAVSSFQSVVFHHWLDTGSTTSSRSVSVTANTEITAVYGTTGSTIFLNPASGPAGTSVTVTGTNFPAGSAIAINYDGVRMTTAPATVTASSSGGFTATFAVPSGSAAGSHTVSATGGTATDTAPFTVKPPASVTASPTAGPISTSVTVTGANFAASTFVNVAFDGTNQVTSPTTVTTSSTGAFTASFTAPSAASGAHTVSARAGATTASTPFTATVPTITITPTSGLPGSTVTISGSNFRPNAAVVINYDGAAVTTTPATVTSTSVGAFSAVTFAVPSSSAPGAHTVRATTVAATASTGFTTASPAAPSITLSPTSGIPDATITVTGSNYPASSTVQVTFNGTATPVASNVTVTSTGTFSTTFAVPSAAAVGAHTVTAATTAGPAATASAAFTVTQPPSVTLTPTSGPPGTLVTVSGSNYPASSTVQVTFGGTNVATATVTSTGTFSTTFSVPTAATSGQTPVNATSGSVGATATFTVTSSPPSITLNPASGPPGTSVTVTGSHYPANSAVTISFNGTNMTTSPATVTTTSTGTFSASFTVPSSSAAGAATVAAKTGSASSTATFTVTPPALIVLNPTSGPTGTSVTITGSNYPPSAAVAITFNGTSVTTTPASITTTSTGTFSATFTVPSSSGLGRATVRAASGSSAGTAIFTVTDQPSIILSPSSGPGGTQVTVTGSNYPASAAIAITFGGSGVTTSPATITTTSAGAFTAAFNVTSSTTSGAKTVTAATTSGPAATASATFTVSTPSITLSPTSGHAGSTVTVTGSNYPVSSRIQITFNATNVATATATSTGSFSTTFTVPSSAGAGRATVNATSGTASSTATFDVTPMPSIALSPTSGPPGVQVTVTGSNFPASSTVTIIYDSSPVTTTPANVTTSSTGTFSAVFAVPASATGDHTVNATSGAAKGTATFTVTSPPAITLSPTSGTAGTQVTVTGSNFPPASTVTIRFNGTSVTTNPATITSTSTGNFSATFAVPSSATAGPNTVRASGGSASATATFSVALAPSATLSPNSGPTGTSVTVTGSNFASNSAITITYNGTQVTTTPASITSDASGGFTATFAVPPSTAGSHAVSIRDGTNTSTRTFTVAPALNPSPTSGPVGTRVTVNGTGFAANSAIAASYDGSAIATNPSTITSDSRGGFSATITIPSSTAGAHPIDVTDGSKNNATTSFTVTRSIALNPTSGNVDAQVTVNGKGFRASAAITVSFAGVQVSTTPATIMTDLSGNFTATFRVPSAASGAHAVTATGSLGNTASADFTVTPSTALSPTSGPAGAQVTVNGTGFAANSAVAIAYDGTLQTTNPSNVTTSAAGSFSAIFSVPLPSTTGAHTVRTASGSANVNATFTVTASAIPSITLSPTSGAIGTNVTVTGSHYPASTAVQVTFNGTNVANTTSTATGSITISFKVPSSAAAGANTVTAAGGAATASATFTVTTPSQTPSITPRPNSGPAGTQVTVNGTGFAASSAITITFDSVQLLTTPSNVVSDSTGNFSAVIRIPSSSAGNHNIGASDARSNIASATFLYTNSSISLNPPTAKVGSTVTVTGSNFASNSAITITYNGTQVTTTPASITSDASGGFTATFAVPPSTAGSHVVGAAAGSNEVLKTLVIVPAISVNPTSGPIGTSVTVNGTGFTANSGVGVTYDSAAVTTTPAAITTSSTGGFTATFAIPTSTAGDHAIDATSGSLSAAAQFTVTALASVTVSPASGPVGSSVTVTGSNYPTNTQVAVTFNGTSITTTPATITTTATGNFSATFTVPSSAAAGPNTVTATAGTRSASDTFAVTTPGITLSPTSGSASTQVTITGSNYPAGARVTVTFNGTSVPTNPAPLTASQSGSFSATFNVPTSSSVGIATVRAVNGTAVATAPFTVAPPASISLSPGTGPAGTHVTVNGTGFASSSAITVRFDTTQVATATSNAQGGFSTTFNVPAAATSGAHAVRAVDASSRIGTANFTVSSPPIANSQTVNLAENTPTTITLTGSDPDGGPIKFYIVSQPQHGILSEIDQATGKIVYWPLKNYVGTDSYTFVTNDCTADSAIATVSLNVTSGTNLPVDVTVYTDSKQSTPLAGYQIFLEQGGVDIASLFSPGTFTLNFGQLYTIVATGFADFNFDHWLDTGSTNNHRDVSPPTDTGIVAVYRQATISLNPTTGSTGTVVTVTGAGFDPNKGITLKFNGLIVQTTPSPLVTDNSGGFTARFTVPAIQTGDYTVTATDGASTAGQTFTAGNAITLSPTSGPTGTPVTVTGSNFAANSAITIRFNTTQVATATSNAQGAFTATFAVPSSSTPGTYQVQASDAANHVSTASFAVTNAVISLSPTSAKTGTPLTVNGTGFASSSAITVRFDTTQVATATSNAQGAFTATFNVPATATNGPHNVQASDGVNSPVTQLTIYSTIISLSPTSGGIGATVTVNGTGFASSSAITVRFDTTQVATATSNAQGAFTASFAVPAGSTSGTHTVNATDAASNAASAQFTVTQTSTLVVSTQDAGGNAITGYFISLSSGGTTVATGFSPVTFTLNNTQAYSVAVSGFQNVVFDHWLDNGSTANPRSITITTTTQLTAVYRAAATTLSPTSGPTGTVVTVTGTQFAKGSQISITLDGASVTTNPPVVTADAPTGAFTAALTIPSTAIAGSRTIAATDGVTPVSRTFTVTPTILLNPTSGQAGTTSVTVTGNNFSPGSTITIRFDGTAVQTNPANVTVSSTRQFSANFAVPAGAAIGQHTVTASNSAGQTASQSFAVTNAAITLNPTSAKVGSAVAVNGTGFIANHAVTITFDGTTVTTSPTAVTTDASGSFTGVTFNVPAASDGLHNVQASDGTNGPIRQLTVYTTAISQSPSAAGAGTPVTVNGTGFASSSAITVRFDTTQVATATSNAQGAFTTTFNVPPASAGSHTVVATDAASPANSASASFVVTTQSTLTVTTKDTNGNTLTGYYTTVTPAGGSTQTGFTPVTFTVPNGSVSVAVSGFGTFVFDHWADNNSTADPRTITVSTNMQLVAVLRNTP